MVGGGGPLLLTVRVGLKPVGIRYCVVAVVGRRHWVAVRVCC